jgi:hypothetical protein
MRSLAEGLLGQYLTWSGTLRLMACGGNGKKWRLVQVIALPSADEGRAKPIISNAEASLSLGYLA